MRNTRTAHNARPYTNILALTVVHAQRKRKTMCCENDVTTMETQLFRITSCFMTCSWRRKLNSSLVSSNPGHSYYVNILCSSPQFCARSLTTIVDWNSCNKELLWLGYDKATNITHRNVRVEICHTNLLVESDDMRLRLCPCYPS